MPMAYYNENDSRMAAWLRELIAAGLIAAGDVDERINLYPCPAAKLSPLPGGRGHVHTAGLHAGGC